MIVGLFWMIFISCRQQHDNEHIAASAESIFQLNSVWKTEENKEIVLSDLKGSVLVVVMIYTSCKAACPRLVADMKNIEKQLPRNKIQHVQMVLVSIDPENDTPEKLKAFANENQMDGRQWTFLQGNIETVQELANVLSVKYKQIAPMDFSHSNIISVFSPDGTLVSQQEGLGVNNKITVDAIIQTLKKYK